MGDVRKNCGRFNRRYATESAWSSRPWAEAHGYRRVVAPRLHERKIAMFQGIVCTAER